MLIPCEVNAPDLLQPGAEAVFANRKRTPRCFRCCPVLPVRGGGMTRARWWSTRGHTPAAAAAAAAVAAAAAAATPTPVGFGGPTGGPGSGGRRPQSGAWPWAAGRQCKASRVVGEVELLRHLAEVGEKNKWLADLLISKGQKRLTNSGQP